MKLTWSEELHVSAHNHVRKPTSTLTILTLIHPEVTSPIIRWVEGWHPDTPILLFIGLKILRKIQKVWRILVSGIFGVCVAYVVIIVSRNRIA